MKTVELKTVDIEVLGNKQEFSYEEMIAVLMETPSDPLKGAGVDEIRKSIRVLEALSTSNGQLDLEDADFDYLFGRVKTARFTASHQAFVDFVDHFETAEKGN